MAATNNFNNNHANTIPQQLLLQQYCYVCGMRGHLSADCELATPVWQVAFVCPAHSDNTPLTRNSYNCKQQGHNSKQCPVPRAPKQCFRCDSLDHLSRDCPQRHHHNHHNNNHNQQQIVTGARSCFACGDLTHMARECPHRAAAAAGVMMTPSCVQMHHAPAPPHAFVQHAPSLHAFGTVSGLYQQQQPQQQYPSAQYYAPAGPMLHAPPPQPPPVDMSDVMCLKCAGFGHVARGCVNPQICWTCMESGTKCFTCGEMGHTARHCASNTGIGGGSTNGGTRPSR
ncbi:hypothetical protein HDU83_003091 [Entophlyctis luteolus]|nr:hypothetical protein HDU83_003091 [Entophlyctis luteolus]